MQQQRAVWRKVMWWFIACYSPNKNVLGVLASRQIQTDFNSIAMVTPAHLGRIIAVQVNYSRRKMLCWWWKLLQWGVWYTQDILRPINTFQNISNHVNILNINCTFHDMMVAGYKVMIALHLTCEMHWKACAAHCFFLSRNGPNGLLHIQPLQSRAPNLLEEDVYAEIAITRATDRLEVLEDLQEFLGETWWNSWWLISQFLFFGTVLTALLFPLSHPNKSQVEHSPCRLEDGTLQLKELSRSHVRAVPWIIVALCWYSLDIRST